MRTAGPGEYPVTCLYGEGFAVHLHFAGTADDIINLILLLQMITYGRTRMQHSFAEGHFQVIGFGKETITHRTSTAIMRTWLVFGDVFFVFEDVRLLGLSKCRHSEKAEKYDE